MNIRDFVFFVTVSVFISTCGGSIIFNEYTQSPIGDYSVTWSSSWDSYAAAKANGVYDFNSLDFPIMGYGPRGVLIFDFDGDGDEDIYAANGPGSSNGLFVNQLSDTGSMSFLEKSTQYGIDNTDHDTMGVCYGDIDNDGDPDLVVLGREDHWRMFRNDVTTSGTFVLAATGGPDNISMMECSFGDIDNDGDLDLVIGSGFNFSNALAIIPSMPPLNITHPFNFNHPNFLLRNDGNFTFTDISAASGMKGTEEHVTWGVSMYDYDDDGITDIITANDNGGEYAAVRGRGFLQFFRSLGNGSVVNVTSEVGGNVTGSWMSLSWADLNCDDNMDLFTTRIGSWLATLFSDGRVPSAFSHFIGMTVWLLGSDDDTWAIPFTGTGDVGPTPFGWGSQIEDIDNDGDRDLVWFGCLHNAQAVECNPGAVLENIDCSANFRRNADAFGIGAYSRRGVHGVTGGDLNGDGFPDIVSVSSFILPSDAPLRTMKDFNGKDLFPEFDPDDQFAVDNRFHLQWSQPGFIENITGPNGMLPIGAIPFIGKPAETWNGFNETFGGLHIEINEASNGDEPNSNGWVRIVTLGMTGVTPGGKVNRDGIGAVLRFTPAGGKQVMVPVTGGDSHMSQSSHRRLFGLGSADNGDLTVAWPGSSGQVWNALSGIRSGEEISMPEIPCSFKDFATMEDLNDCLNPALQDLKDAGVIDSGMRNRLRTSMRNAWMVEHP